MTSSFCFGLIAVKLWDLSNLSYLLGAKLASPQLSCYWGKCFVFLSFQLPVMLECWMVVINLFHFHIPLLMDHIGIFSIGLELMSLLQASSSPPVQYLGYKCGRFTHTFVMKVFWKISRGNKEKMFIVFTPKYFDSFWRLILLTAL